MQFASDTIREVFLDIDGVTLGGNLTLPEQAKSLVLFAHGSGSSRFSPRNQQVARYFNELPLATFLFDLLSREEHIVDERTREFRFDIELLARRLVGVLDWIIREPETLAMKVGIFGASTGAAAALIVAAQRPKDIAAVVSRGGRPDLASHELLQVQAPTLLIVGGDDDVVVALNQQVFQTLRCRKKLEIVPGATHLFEEPGKLQEVCELAGKWFLKYLTETGE